MKARHSARSTVDARHALSTGRLVAGLLCLVLGVACGTVPFALMVKNEWETGSYTATHDSRAGSMGEARRAKELSDAGSYNADLAADGQPIMGEAVDPWSGSSSGMSASSTDKRYLSQLNQPDDGVMATIRYPRLSIDLPIRHGTSQSVLAKGAGHLYGSSLPVGGASTHAVISAHTGLADRLMFDRLAGLGPRAKIGDVFYINVEGETLAYKVRSIRVVLPSDFTKLRIQTGRDLVTLLTCTPYGINDHRLLVTGERVSIPDEAAEPGDTPEDHTSAVMIALIVAAWLIVFTVFTMVIMTSRRNGRR